MAVACVATACAVLGGCGGDEKSASASDPALTTGSAQDRIEAMFKSYNGAIAKHDFATACDRLAKESVDAMLKKLEENGAEQDSCEAGFKKIYSVIPDEQAKLLDEIASNAAVKKITVQGETAKVVWTTEANGRTVTLTHGARKVGEEWKFVDTTGGSPQAQ